MAKMETRSVAVSPEQEQGTIEIYEKFGWEVQGSQEILSENTRNETRTSLMGNNELWNITTKTNYVKIVFKRDKEMKNYDKVCELEKEYELNEALYVNSPNFLPGKVLLVIIIACLIVAISGFSGGEIGIGLVGILIGGGIFALRYFTYYKPRDTKAIDARLANDKILEKLEKLV